MKKLRMLIALSILFAIWITFGSVVLFTEKEIFPFISFMAVGAISFIFGCNTIEVPIQNQNHFDFLTKIKMQWKKFIAMSIKEKGVHIIAGALLLYVIYIAGIGIHVEALGYSHGHAVMHNFGIGMFALIVLVIPLFFFGLLVKKWMPAFASRFSFL